MRTTLATSTAHATLAHVYEEMLHSKSDRIGTLEADLASQKGLLLALRSRLREIALAQDEQKTLGIRMLLSSLSEHLESHEQEVKLRENLNTLNESFTEELRITYLLSPQPNCRYALFLLLDFAGKR